MTPDEVRAEVEWIRSSSTGADPDHEELHYAEDKLHHAVLRAIAAGANDPAVLAQEAVKTLGLVFHRSCA